MSAVSRRSGELTDIDVDQLPNFESSDHFNELEKAVLRYATEMSSTPVRISEDSFEVLKREFSEQQLVELTGAIAWENWRARFNHAFGLESAGFEHQSSEAAPLSA